MLVLILDSLRGLPERQKAVRVGVSWSRVDFNDRPVLRVVVYFSVRELLVFLVQLSLGYRGYFVFELLAKEVENVVGETVLQTELGSELLRLVSLPDYNGVYLVFA